MEMEFRSTFGGPVAPYCGYHTVARNGVHENVPFYTNLLLTPASHKFNCVGRRRAITVVEMDGGDFSLNDDDFFGERSNPANFGDPREIFYNFPMPFFSGGSHRADVTIVAQ